MDPGGVHIFRVSGLQRHQVSGLNFRYDRPGFLPTAPAVHTKRSVNKRRTPAIRKAPRDVIVNLDAPLGDFQMPGQRSRQLPLHGNIVEDHRIFQIGKGLSLGNCAPFELHRRATGETKANQEKCN